MATQRAVCIVRNESLTKEVFVVEPTTPVEDFRKMVAEKFQHEVEELDLFLQNSICPLLLLDSNQAFMVDTGINFDTDARNNMMLLPKKGKSKGNNLESDVRKKRKLSLSKSVIFKKHGVSDHVGLINQANTCYLNCLLQSLYMTPEIFNIVISWKWTDDTNHIARQLQKLFILLKTSCRMAIKTTEFTNSFKWAKEHSRDQQDIHELCASLFAELTDSLKKNDITNLIEPKYEGKALDYIKCLECGAQVDRTINFSDVQLPIRNIVTGETYNTLLEALKGYIEPEKLDGDNQYQCSQCNTKCDAEKGLKFVTFPYILNISLMRFDYNFTIQRSFKLGCRVTFPNILDLSEFVEDKSDDDSTNSNVYDLYSVMVHSGTASAGHYYAYIKKLSTGDWSCFNDQKVSPILEEDVERAYGENTDNVRSTRSTNAYMLVYRRVDTKLNEEVTSIENFPQNTKDLMAQYLQEEGENIIEMDVYCKHSIERVCRKGYFNSKMTLEEVTVVAYNLFVDILENIPIRQCRMVCYSPDISLIENSFEDTTIELDTIIQDKGTLECMLLETRKINETFINFEGGTPRASEPIYYKSKDRIKNKYLESNSYEKKEISKVMLPFNDNSYWLKNINFYGNILIPFPKYYGSYKEFDVVLQFMNDQVCTLRMATNIKPRFIKKINSIILSINKEYTSFMKQTEILLKKERELTNIDTMPLNKVLMPLQKLKLNVLLSEDCVQISLNNK